MLIYTSNIGVLTDTTIGSLMEEQIHQEFDPALDSSIMIIQSAT